MVSICSIWPCPDPKHPKPIKNPILENVRETIAKCDEWITVAKNKRGRTVSKGPNTTTNSITREEDRGIGGINNNNLKGEWEVIKVTVDSGAIDTVTPPTSGRYFPIQETESSKRGLHYRAANGTKITNFGARNIAGISGDYKGMHMVMNVADVKKTPASAYQITQAGNKIRLDSEYSYIVNKMTGERTTIEVNNGEFQFDLWVPAPAPDQPPTKVKDGKLIALTTANNDDDDEANNHEVGFIRQDVLP